MAFPLLLLFLLTYHTVFAQSTSGYVVAGIGTSEGKRVSQAALGVEFVIRSVIGAGAEIGAVAGHDSFATFSVNGYGHLPVSSRGRVDPFVTGGYTAAVGLLRFEGNFVNFGGGIVYWLHRSVGLRLEFRDFVRLGTVPAGVNRPGRFYTVRAGIAFQ